MASARSRLRIPLTLGTCLLLAAALSWFLVRRPAPVVTADAAPVLAPPGVGEVSAPAPSAAPQSASSAAARSQIPLTRLPLRLLATVVHENAALSLATLADLERDTHEVIGEGQSLEGRASVRIASIERERVLLDNDGVREQLMLAHGEANSLGSARYEPTPEEREKRRDLSRRLRELTDAGKNYRDLLAPGKRGGLLAEGDVSAAYEDGEMVGVQIDGIRPGGVYDRIGLHNGDVVTDINGVALSDPGAAGQVLMQLAIAPEIVIMAKGSDGAEKAFSFPTDQLRDVLASVPLD